MFDWISTFLCQICNLFSQKVKEFNQKQYTAKEYCTCWFELILKQTSCMSIKLTPLNVGVVKHNYKYNNNL